MWEVIINVSDGQTKQKDNVVITIFSTIIKLSPKSHVVFGLISLRVISCFERTVFQTD